MYQNRLDKEAGFRHEIIAVFKYYFMAKKYLHIKYYDDMVLGTDQIPTTNIYIHSF